MKSILASAFILAAAVPTFAKPAPCVGTAKYGAIRAYKAETGTVQGSDGIEHEARLLSRQGSVSQYEVTIADNNEDGEAWEIQYAVRVEGSGKNCRLLSVKKLSSR